MIQQYINIRPKNDQFDNQTGAVYLLLSIIFLGAFTVAGLAIDISNIFRYNIALQKALDSAAVASAKVIAVIPYNEKAAAANKDKVRKAAFDIISLNFLIGDQNLLCNGAAINNFKLDCSADLTKLEAEESLVITGSLEVPLIFLNKLPGYPAKLIVTNSAKAEVQPAIVKIMLDTSGSMASKFAQLKTSVTDFVGAFNPDRDFLGVSFFSLDAVEQSDMTSNSDPDKKKKGYGAFDAADINSKLNVSFTTSSTNQCAALHQGELDVRLASTPDQRTPVYILFSDGAPSAARFFFKDVKDPALAKNNPYGGVNTEYDYLSWLIRVDGVETPSELARAPLPGENIVFPFNWGYAFPPQPPISGVDMCSEGPPQDCPPDPGIDMSAPCSTVDKNNPHRSFSGCLDNLRFYTPDGEVWPDLIDDGTFSNYMESYYNCAIAMSDYIRYEGNGVVYAIGLGNAATDNATAYQNVHDLESRKDILFSRLANVAEYENSNPRFPGKYELYVNPHPGIPPVPSYLSQGAYFPVDSASSLPEVFKDLYNKIVRKIKVVQLMPVS